VNRFGPYRLIRPLCPVAGWERFIALHDRDDTDHVLYRHPPVHDGSERRRLVSAVAPLASVRHPHLLEVSAYSFDEQDRLCLITPYTGNQEGLVTLVDLMERRSGRLEVPEVARCVEHLLSGVAAARSAGLGGGPVEPERVLVDRRGAVRVELYGLPGADRVYRGVCTGADEVRAIASMAVWLLTGLRQDVAPSSVARIAGRGARVWEPWLEMATDPVAGFESPQEALDALPTRDGADRTIALPVVVVPGSPSRLAGMLRRFRRAAVQPQQP
jgi:hypothetical protein